MQTHYQNQPQTPVQNHPVKVTNKTSKKQLGLARPLTTLAAKVKGLMFNKKCTEILLFHFRHASIAGSAIHSFFCPPFEAIYLDEHKRVINARAISPGTSRIKPTKPAKFLLECPPGTINKSKTKPGDVLNWN